MLRDRRARLAEKQTQLARALTAGSPPPAEFDALAVARAALSIAKNAPGSPLIATVSTTIVRLRAGADCGTGGADCGTG
ncbi:MAG: hypothetical protein MJE77_41615 [Proteobacteria bacterium]|nr:hypothetical protein [Pseudomonadota bacterium]